MKYFLFNRRQVSFFEKPSSSSSSSPEGKADSAKNEAIQKMREASAQGMERISTANVFEHNATELHRQAKAELYKIKEESLGKILNSGAVTLETGFQGKHYDSFNRAVTAVFEEELAKLDQAAETLKAEQEAIVRTTEIRDNVENYFRSSYNTLVVLQGRQERLFKIETHTADGFIKTNAMSIDGAKTVLEYNADNQGLLKKAEGQSVGIRPYAKEAKEYFAKTKLPFVQQMQVEMETRATQIEEAIQSRTDSQKQCDRLTQGIRLIFIEAVANKDPKTLSTGDHYIKTAKAHAGENLIAEDMPKLTKPTATV